MLDGVIEYLPSPVDIPPVPGLNEDDEPVVRKAEDTEEILGSGHSRSQN